MERTKNVAGTAKLKPGREKSLLNRHPWVFSGALAERPAVPDGALVSVLDSQGNTLGNGYYNSRPSISIRMLSFSKQDPLAALSENIQSAIALRRSYLNPQTTAYRLINGEGDGVPGLIVDQYADVLVLQIGTLGIENIKAEIISLLKEFLHPRAIYEKSNLPSREEEGLPPFEGFLTAPAAEELEVLENGLRFAVNLRESQKTGLFLDQREMRALVGHFAKGKEVLNCFSYSGGFSLYAAKGGARKVDSVDISAGAVEQARRNFALNGLGDGPHDFIVADVFKHLRELRTNYDFIILDPPAFAKKKSHIKNACRGYGEINQQALRRINKRGLLLTCSCSYYVDEKLFQQVLFQAASAAGRAVRILERHRQALDHPISIFHPEGNYLKSLLLEVE